LLWFAASERVFFRFRFHSLNAKAGTRMRASIWLLALVAGTTVSAAASAQNPTDYDPTYYDQFGRNGQNGQNSLTSADLMAIRQKEQKKFQPGVLAKMGNFTMGVVRTVAMLPPPPTVNDVIPHVQSGPGSPLQQPNSPSGNTTEAELPIPPTTSMFGRMTNSFPSLFGKNTPTGPIFTTQPTGTSLFPSSMTTKTAQP
jgi:hypothetical protein